jgi:hypothetical protein
MTKIRCECAQQLRPVETVDKLGGKPPTKPAGFPPHAPPFQKLDYLSDVGLIQAAVLDALDLLTARIEELEARVTSLIAIRSIRDEMP